MKAFRAYFFAQSAVAARIDEFVSVALSHYYGEIVIDLSDVFFGIPLEARQEFTYFDAFHALALKAPFCLLDSFLLRIAGASVSRRDTG